MRSVLNFNRRGFTLVEVLMAAGIITALVAAGASVIKTASEIKKKTDTYDALTNYRTDLIATLRSSDAIAQTATYSANTNALCLKTLQNCGSASTASAPLTILDATGANKKTDMTTASFGFNIEGQTCTSFPSTSCPFRYETYWYSVCAGGATCITPQIKSTGTLQVYEGFPVKVNASQFNYTITLGQVIGSYEQGCTSIGGTYVPGEPPQCNLPMTGDCPPGQYVVGYNKATKQKQCRPVFQNALNASCNSGEVMVGVDASGTPVCKQMKANTGCASPYDPRCQPYYCQVYPTAAICQAVAAASGTDGDGGGDGGCDGGDGCN